MELKNEHLTRQFDLIPSEALKVPVTIIGAGAIGGWVALSLAKMGMTDIMVYDDDIVDVENMNSQFYRFKDIGKPKVVALKKLIFDFTDIIIKSINEKYTGNVMHDGIVVSAVDNMGTRKLVWETHEGKSLNTKLIIDPRMGAETALMYAMNPMSPRDNDSYIKTLYTDEAAVREPCTAKSTIYCANLLAGMVVKTVKDCIVGSDYSRTLMWDVAHNDFVSFSNKA